LDPWTTRTRSGRGGPGDELVSPARGADRHRAALADRAGLSACGPCAGSCCAWPP